MTLSVLDVPNLINQSHVNTSLQAEETHVYYTLAATTCEEINDAWGVHDRCASVTVAKNSCRCSANPVYTVYWHNSRK